MGNYSLQKYKGTATRHTCPKCGDRHSFVYYVDENNVPLHPSVGRCNHESGCGYHYTPKEYFQEHPEHRTTNDFYFDRQRAEQKKVKQQSKPTPIGYIPPHYVEKSQSERSNFFRFLFTLLTSYYGDKAKEVLKRLLEEYRLGATRDGSVIFWQIDRTGKVRTGKVMEYNPEDGHRIKGGETSADELDTQHIEKAACVGRGLATIPMPFRGTLVENASRQGGGLGGIREKCRYRFCYLPRLCMAGYGW